MAKVYFRFNLQKDIENWWDACNSSFMGVDWKLKIPKYVRSKIVGKDKGVAETFLKKYLKQRYNPNSKFVKKFKKEIPGYWKQREKEIFKRIEKITKKQVWRKLPRAKALSVLSCKINNSFLHTLNKFRG
ncbi:MAG: hypothetical protein KKD18_03910, partial [Nanoarchaeota archaeon]|nr:hypothetical protein [Nanoarchaeota archaeon]